MSAAAPSNATVRTTLIRILSDTAASIKQLSDLGTQLTHVGKSYMYLKYVLKNIVQSYDEVDSVIRRSTELYARHDIQLVHAIDQYGKMSAGIIGAVGVFQQLIRTQGMTEASMLRLTQQARQLSFVLNKSMEDIGKTMVAVKADLGLTDKQLEKTMNTLGLLSSRTGISIDTLSRFAREGGSVSRAFGGTTEAMVAFTDAMVRATGSEEGALQMLNKLIEGKKTYGASLAGLDGQLIQFSQLIGKDNVKAMEALNDAVSGLTEEKRRMWLMTGKLTSIEIQYLENLSKESKAIQESTDVIDGRSSAVRSLSDVYNRVVGGVGAQLKILGDNVKDFGRSFAVYLAPAISSVLYLLNKFIEVAKSLPEPVRGILGMVAGVYIATQAISRFARILGLVSGVSVGLGATSAATAGWFTAVGTAIKGAALALASFTVAALPYIAVAAVIAAAVAVIVHKLGGLENVLVNVRASWNYFVEGFLEGLGGSTRELYASLEAFKAVIGAAYELIFGVEKGYTQVEDFTKSFKTLGQWAAWAFKISLKPLEYLIYYTGLAIAYTLDFADAVSTSYEAVGEFAKRLGSAMYDTLVEKIGEVKQLWNRFMTWLGLSVKDDFSVTNNKQVDGVKDLARSLEAANEAADKTNKKIIEAKQNLAQSIVPYDVMNQETEDVIVGGVPASPRSIVVTNRTEVMSKSAQAAAVASTQPITYSNPPEPVTTRQMADMSQNTTMQPIQIVLDDYVLGQALVNLNRKMRVLGYADADGSLHGIR